MDECPICTDPLVGNVATLGCCNKVMHVECLVKCMSINLSCPMCRTIHDSLSFVQNTPNPTVLVDINNRNKYFFRNWFIGSVASSILIVYLNYTCF